MEIVSAGFIGEGQLDEKCEAFQHLSSTVMYKAAKPPTPHTPQIFENTSPSNSKDWCSIK